MRSLAPRLARPLLAAVAAAALALSVVGQVHAHHEIDHDEACAACVVVHTVAVGGALVPVPAGVDFGSTVDVAVDRDDSSGAANLPNGRAPPVIDSLSY